MLEPWMCGGVNLENHQSCLLQNHRDNNKRKSDDLEEGIRRSEAVFSLRSFLSPTIHRFVQYARNTHSHLSQFAGWSSSVSDWHHIGSILLYGGGILSIQRSKAFILCMFLFILSYHFETETACEKMRNVIQVHRLWEKSKLGANYCGGKTFLVSRGSIREGKGFD